MKNTIIEVKDLRKEFSVKTKDVNGKKESKNIVAVDNVSFDVKEGEIIGFIGPNGAGKSTTIKILTGILHPTSGEALVVGYSPWKSRVKMSYNIGTMFGQKSCLLPHLPIIDSYNLLGAIYDIDKNTLKERIDEIVSFFGIEHLISKPAKELSLGQRMICEVAAVTLHRPSVIFFDEPTIGLDIVVKKKVRELILSLNKKYGTTIFITSHDISDIEQLCSRIILINHGKVIIDENLKSIKDSYLTKRKITAVIDSNWDKAKVISKFPEPDFGVEQTDDNIVLEFDSKNIDPNKVISDLFSICNVSDINIAGTQLESVIYDIYTTQKERDKS